MSQTELFNKSIPTKFEYNGASYNFDARDADDAERFEKALEEMRKVESSLPKDGLASTMLKGQCEMLKKFFDDCLGEGAGVAICTEKNNISVHYDAYENFLMLVRSQKDDILRAKNTFAKYSNRQQKRAAAKKKK